MISPEEPGSGLLFTVLGFKLRAYNLSHSTSPIFVKGFCEIES
jgi:hypothetical protein